MNASGARIAVVVPCRDEARVLPRKLRNLALCEWPPPAAGHLVLVVDDHSSDDTARVAQAMGDGFPCALRVLSNDHAPGKAGAIQTALDALDGEQEPVDLVVLTDADVIVRPPALRALLVAFQADRELAMASGAQEFVRDLADDGTCRGEGLSAPEPAAGLYDRWTAKVRALESRSGRLFSVHGQLLAWRLDLGLRATPGIAADDLDLMLQARARGGRVRLVDAARFLERKTPRGEGRDGQAFRRARAYFQVIGGEQSSGGGGVFDRLQLGMYRVLPALAPWAAGLAALVGLPMLAFLGWRLGGGLGLAAALLAIGVLASLPVTRRLAWLLGVIARAWWRERRDPISDRWEMERG